MPRLLYGHADFVAPVYEVMAAVLFFAPLVLQEHLLLRWVAPARVERMRARSGA